ncbi:Rik1-associated factor 1 [Ancistrocladus abbreviatus]
MMQPLLILVSSITNSKSSIFKPISASSNPPSPIIPASASPQPQNLYQPFRLPPSPLPSQYRNLDTAGRIDILCNRLGLWFQYAPLISALSHEGFTPPSIEELTGISGVEQNRLVVATKVRESLLESPQLDPDALSYFDNGGAELLYEIRLLSATQRAAAACYLVENRLDAKGARDVARAIKDFPLRRGDPGWESFDYSLPGDCLSFMYFRQSGEHKNPSGKRTAALELALKVAGSEKAKKRVLKELEDKGEGTKGEEEFDDVRVPVVRMKTGEVAEASKVVVLPVCREEEKEDGVSRAPFECGSEGAFGIVASDKVWDRWVVLPGWEPVVGLGGKGGVVVSFGDARALPWKGNRWYKEEPILVVADRGRKEVTMNHGFYLVMMCDDNGGAGGSLKVERGSALKDKGVKESLGTVVLVVRPPKEEIEDQLSDDDWE